MRSRFFEGAPRDTASEEIARLLASVRRERQSTLRANPSGAGGGEGEACSEELCAICLEPPSPVARLEGCSHAFCEGCISRWCAQCSKCPLCKREAVAHTSALSGRVAVAARELGGEALGAADGEWPDSADEESEAHNCQLCGGGELPDEIVLCDGCDSGFHLLCLDPPLGEVPAGRWACPECELLAAEALAERRRRERRHSPARAARRGRGGRARAEAWGQEAGESEGGSEGEGEEAQLDADGARTRKRLRRVVVCGSSEGSPSGGSRPSPRALGAPPALSGAGRGGGGGAVRVLCPATPAEAGVGAASALGGPSPQVARPGRPPRQRQQPRLSLRPAQPEQQPPAARAQRTSGGLRVGSAQAGAAERARHGRLAGARAPPAPSQHASVASGSGSGGGRAGSALPATQRSAHDATLAVDWTRFAFDGGEVRR